MGIHKINDYTIKMDFIREKYELARWDYSIEKDGKEIASGVDVNTVSFDEKDAIIEILLEVFDESVHLEEYELDVL